MADAKMEIHVQGLDSLIAKIDVKAKVTKRQVKDAGQDIANFAQREAKVRLLNHTRTGNLVRNIRVYAKPAPNGWEIKMSVTQGAPYAKWVEHGTGLFGPRHALIYAKRGGVMRFQAGFPTGAIVYAKHTKGMKGVHFMEEAAKAAKAYAPVRLQQLAHDVGNL